MHSFAPLLRGVVGVVVLVAIAVLFSRNRRAIRPRVVLAALATQLGIGALMLFVPAGRTVLRLVAAGVTNVLDYGQQGVTFMFGGLVGPQMDTLFAHGSGYIVALRVLPQIIYISALIAVLYYLRVMQYLAQGLGWLFRRIIGTTRIESFVAVTTIFLGMSETPVAIKPFIPLLTEAELFAALCSGTASVAGSILAGYAGLGVPMDYLLAACFMAIPGGLLFAKLLWPSSDETRIATMQVEFEAQRPANIFEAAAIGTMNGVHVAVAVGAMLIAFIGLIALLDGLVGGTGHLLGFAHWSLQGIFGALFAPLAWVIGVPWALCHTVGDIIGQKIVFNEFVAYVSLSPYLHGLNAGLDHRSVAITAFALCGFANFSSIGILLATYGALTPERRGEVARFGLRAVLAGTLSNLMSATIAGMFLA